MCNQPHSAVNSEMLILVGVEAPIPDCKCFRVRIPGSLASASPAVPSTGLAIGWPVQGMAERVNELTHSLMRKREEWNWDFPR